MAEILIILLKIVFIYLLVSVLLACGLYFYQNQIKQEETDAITAFKRGLGWTFYGLIKIYEFFRYEGNGPPATEKKVDNVLLSRDAYGNFDTSQILDVLKNSSAGIFDAIQINNSYLSSDNFLVSFKYNTILKEEFKEDEENLKKLLFAKIKEFYQSNSKFNYLILDDYLSLDLNIVSKQIDLIYFLEEI